MQIKTRQEFRRAILRGAWRGLKYQKFEQAIKNNSCMWDDGTGRHCGVGWLIDSSKYKDRARTGSTIDVVRKKLLAEPLQRYADRHALVAVDDLYHLQWIHDNCVGHFMEQELISLAHYWNVPLPEE